MFKIAVFIRCAHDKPLSEGRLLLFQRTINSLKAQLFKHFSVYVITGGIWKQQGTRENTERIFSLDWGQLNVFLLPDSDIPKHSCNIQIRLDSDDWISPLYIAKCVDVYQQTDIDDFIITFRPYFRKNNALYARDAYSEQKPSAFSVLCQKTKVKHWCYEVPHTLMAEMVPYVVVVDAGFCVANVHESNMSTRIFTTDRKLEI